MKMILLCFAVSSFAHAAEAPIEIIQGTVIKWKCATQGIFGVMCEKAIGPEGHQSLGDECLKGAPAGCLSLKLNETNTYCAEKIAFRCVKDKANSKGE